MFNSFARKTYDLHFYQISLLQSNNKITIQRGRKNVQLTVHKTTWKNRTFATRTLLLFSHQFSDRSYGS